MNKKIDFAALEPQDQERYVKHTWCHVCEKPDLGITNPEVYVSMGEVYVQGLCAVCGTECALEHEVNHLRSSQPDSEQSFSIWRTLGLTVGLLLFVCTLIVVTVVAKEKFGG